MTVLMVMNSQLNLSHLLLVLDTRGLVTVDENYHPALFHFDTMVGSTAACLTHAVESPSDRLPC